MNPLRLSALSLAILLTAASAAPPLPAIPLNTWVQVHPTYSGAPNGCQIWIQGWNNMGVYDPGSRCTISMDRWLDPFLDCSGAGGAEAVLIRRLYCATSSKWSFWGLAASRILASASSTFFVKAFS